MLPTEPVRSEDRGLSLCGTERLALPLMAKGGEGEHCHARRMLVAKEAQGFPPPFWTSCSEAGGGGAFASHIPAHLSQHKLLPIYFNSVL